MAKLKDILQSYAGTTSPSSTIEQINELLPTVSQFMADNKFVNFEKMGPGDDSLYGKNSLILKDLDNPKLVFRFSYADLTPDEIKRAMSLGLDVSDYMGRPVVPQVLQPIHVKRIGKLKIEIMPNASVPEEMPEERRKELYQKFWDEVENAGHEMQKNNQIEEAKLAKIFTGSDALSLDDIGYIRYEDAKRPGTFHEAFIGVDEGTMKVKFDAVPTCGSDYPTLEDQWREQCKIVEADPRLQKLLGGLPPKPPPTKQRGDISRA